MNKESPCVEVIIPTYNRAVMLRRAIKSVQLQKYKNVKIKIIDNASTDETRATIECFQADDSRIEYIRHDVNIGMLANLNFAFSKVSKEYFCILTDDDFYSSNFISDSISILQSNRDVGFVALETLYVDSSGKLIERNLSERNAPEKIGIGSKFVGFDAFRYMTSWSFPLSIISIVFTKPLADLYVEHDNGLDVGSDIKYLWMCAAKYGWIAHPKIGAFVTVHPGSFSVDKDVVTWEHDVIQNMRYVELIKNPDISEEVRVYSRRLLVESLRKTKVGFYFWATLRKILHAIYKNRPAEHCAADIRSFALSKRLVLARLLGIINNVGVIRKIVGASIRIFISVRRSLRKDVSVDTRNPDYADILEELKLHVE